MEWRQLIVVVVVVVGTLVLARIVDWRMSRRELPPEAATRYRVLRRSLTIAIIFVGLLSAALVVPQVRAVAAGILASSAVVGLVIGFAAQRPLANFVAGVVIAFTQPLRLGDLVTVDGIDGTVEEIGLTYTFIRTADNTRLVIPNEKLASDPLLNSTIRGRQKLAEATLQLPLDKDLDAAVEAIRQETAADQQAEVLVTGLNGTATLTVRTWAPDAAQAERIESELRLRILRRLREESLL